MITGFNTDIKFNEKVYHVQTEDRGRDNPILESLVYVKGQILDAVQTPYHDRLVGGTGGAEGIGEEELAQMLEAQHKKVIRSIKNGRYDPDGIKPFGHGIITDRSLDEVVVDFIQKQREGETVEIQVEEMGELTPGWTGALQITLRTDVLDRPVRECFVRISAERPDGKKTLRLFEGITDRDGRVLAEVTLPESPARGQLQIVAATEPEPTTATVDFPRDSGSR